MRFRIRLLPHGNWSVEYKKWPWSRWREEDFYPSRTKEVETAVERARRLISIFNPIEVSQ